MFRDYAQGVAEDNWASHGCPVNPKPYSPPMTIYPKPYSEAEP